MERGDFIALVGIHLSNHNRGCFCFSTSEPNQIVFISVLLALRLTSRKKEPVEQHDDSSEGPSSDSDSSQTLFNTSKEKIESQRKYRVTERKRNTFERDMVFSCVFLILLMIVCYGDKNENRYRSKLHKVSNAYNILHTLFSCMTASFPSLLVTESLPYSNPQSVLNLKWDLQWSRYIFSNLLRL